jgi:hypothetical protein
VRAKDRTLYPNSLDDDYAVLQILHDLEAIAGE